jgi:hypothetical protein
MFIEMTIGASDGRELRQILLKHVPLQRQDRKLALSHHLDEPRAFQLLDMVRYGGSAYAVLLVQDAAGQRVTVRADLLQDAIAPRLRKRACDACYLPLGETGHAMTLCAQGRSGQG